MATNDGETKMDIVVRNESTNELNDMCASRNFVQDLIIIRKKQENNLKSEATTLSLSSYTTDYLRKRSNLRVTRNLHVTHKARNVQFLHKIYQQIMKKI